MTVQQSGGPSDVTIEDSALQGIQNAARLALPNEVGGILIGYRRGASVNVVRAVVVVDPSASPYSYARRHAQAQVALDAVRSEEPDNALLGWVGEWHSHPGPSGPSHTDLQELLSLARIDGHAIALIVIALRAHGWTVHARLAVGRRVYAPVQFQVQDRGEKS